MGDDTDTDAEQTETTLDELMEFIAERVTAETEDFEGEVPNHAARLLVDRVADLNSTITKIQMHDAAEDVADITEEERTEALEEDAIDVLFALGALSAEHDLDIPTAFADRMEFIQNYEAFEDAIDETATEAEAMAAFEEHMGEELEMGGVEAWMNVDNDDYDHDATNRPFQ